MTVDPSSRRLRRVHYVASVDTRARRGVGMYVIYGVAGALLMGIGALALGQVGGDRDWAAWIGLGGAGRDPALKRTVTLVIPLAPVPDAAKPPPSAVAPKPDAAAAKPSPAPGAGVTGPGTATPPPAPAADTTKPAPPPAAAPKPDTSAPKPDTAAPKPPAAPAASATTAKSTAPPAAAAPAPSQGAPPAAPPPVAAPKPDGVAPKPPAVADTAKPATPPGRFEAPPAAAPRPDTTVLRPPSVPPAAPADGVRTTTPPPAAPKPDVVAPRPPVAPTSPPGDSAQAPLSAATPKLDATPPTAPSATAPKPAAGPPQTPPTPPPTAPKPDIAAAKPPAASPVPPSAGTPAPARPEAQAPAATKPDTAAPPTSSKPDVADAKPPGAPGDSTQAPPSAAAPKPEASPPAAPPPGDSAPTAPPAPSATALAPPPPAATPAPTPAAAPAPVLIAANGLPAPPPEKPPVPPRCPPLDPLSLTELTPEGRLPRIDANGCLAWLAHAAAFDAREARPRMGVIVVGLGRSTYLTQRAIDELPASVSLGFWPDTPQLERWIERARAKGHEVLVALPVQPAETTLPPLRADLSADENRRRLHAVLARAGSGYVGLIVPAASPLSASEAALRPLLKEISDRGLLLLETFRTGRTVYQIGKEVGLPYSADAGWIDRDGQPGESAANLQALEEFTRRNRFALAVATARRATIDQLVAWSKDVEVRGLALTPVSGLTECLNLCAERLRKARSGGW